MAFVHDTNIPLRSIVERAVNTLGLHGMPIDNSVFETAWAAVVAAWQDPSAFRVEYQASVRAPTDDEMTTAQTAISDAIATAASLAADKAKTRTFLTGAATVRSHLSVFKTRATTLSGKTYSGTTAAQLSAVETDVKAIAGKLAELIGDLETIVDGIMFLARQATNQ